MDETNNQMSLYEVMHSINAEFEAKEKEIKKIEEDMASLDKQLLQYKVLVEKYSTFDSNTIGTILSELMSAFEEEEFVCQKAEHETYKAGSSIWGGGFSKFKMKTLLIIKKELVEDLDKEGYYYDWDERHNEITKLTTKKLAFLLDEHQCSYSKTVSFYYVYNRELKSFFDFNSSFPYIQEFIDFIIEYRYENHLVEISEQELQSLKEEFLLNKKEEIGDYQKRTLAKQSQN